MKRLLTAALLSVSSLALAQGGELPAGHPPIPPGTGASPARPAPETTPQGAAAPTPTTAPPQQQGALPEGHPPLDAAPPPSGAAPAPSAEELLRQLDATPGLKEKEKTFDIAVSVGRLYYAHGRAQDALPYFLQAEAKAGQTLALWRKLRGKAGAAAQQPAGPEACGLAKTARFEALAEAAAARGRKGDAAGAAACARAALEPVVDVTAQRGHALWLGGDAAGALAAYEAALEVAPRHPEALFGRSVVLYETRGEDPKALERARAGFAEYAAAHPQAARAPLAGQLAQVAADTLKAGGRRKFLASRAEDRKVRLSQPLPGAPQPQAPGAAAPPALAGAPALPGAAGGGDAALPQVSAETIAAMQSVERTPELEQQLDGLLEQGEGQLAQRQFDAALATYRQVMPLRATPRVQAGLAWALIGLQRPTAERIWGVAVQNDPAEVERLGDRLKAKNDAAGARELWSRLARTAPDYARRANLEAKLK